MSDRELEALRQKKLKQMKEYVKSKTKVETEKPQEGDQRKVLNRLFVGRAWEVLNAAKAQYPEAANQIENTLVKLITEGKIRSRITGEELYGLFLRVGLRVRLQTRIQVLEHGKVKSLEEKIKEETSQ